MTRTDVRTDLPLRADRYLTETGQVESRTLAARMIDGGVVFIDGRRVDKPSQEIGAGLHTVEIRENDFDRFVGRGGLKLEAALERFNVDVSGLTVADIGASTGGFTDCLLTRGVACSFCVDCGHGQLHPKIAHDPRVVRMDGCNAKTLTRDLLSRAYAGSGTRQPGDRPFDGTVDGCVMDVSFISQTLLHAACRDVIRPGGFLISLIKPQFELNGHGLSGKGVVTSEKDRKRAIERVTESAGAFGLICRGIITSPITGGDGNTEYLAYFVKEVQPGSPT